MDETMGNQQAKSLIDLGWIAGIVDGEGWMILNLASKGGQAIPRKTLVPVIGMGTTSVSLAENYRRILHELGVGFWTKVIHTHQKHPKWSDQVTIQVRGLRRCRTLLDKILPHLVLKSKQGNLLRSYIDYRLSLKESGRRSNIGDIDEKYREELKGLNQKGKSLNDYTPKQYQLHDIV